MDLGDDIIAPRSVSMVGRNINCKCANGLSGRHNYGVLSENPIDAANECFSDEGLDSDTATQVADDAQHLVA